MIKPTLVIALTFTSMPTQAAPLYAFTTSTIGTGRLEDWPEVAGMGVHGLEAADAICRFRAADAHLPNSSEFVAWLSDRDSDAYCHLFGLSGKKADRCGHAELPWGSGPWFRVDAMPFAERLSAAGETQDVYSPLETNENGVVFSHPVESFTATRADGTLDTIFDPEPDCEHWTSASDDPTSQFATLGWSVLSSVGWTETGTAVSCSGHRHLVCLQRGASDETIPLRTSGRREAFITSQDVTGALDGIAGADSICRQAATDAGLYQANRFKALIASSSANVHALNRFEFDGPWYRRDGLLFASGKNELASGHVNLPLNLTQLGEYVGFAVALTGARADGSPREGHDCNGWSGGNGIVTGSLVNGVRGLGNAWFDNAQVTCMPQPPSIEEWPRKLMCLLDADVLFHDSFELW